MKKILLLLSGQLRTFDFKFVEKSWSKFFRTYDVTTVGCFWDNRGCSLYPSDVDNPDETLDINYVKDKLQTEYVRLFDYSGFLDNLSDCFVPYRDIKYFSASISSSFLRYEAKYYTDTLNQITDRDTLKDFDLTISTRPDLIWFRQLPDYCFNTQTFWHQNMPPAHYPERIYDNLMMSSVDNIFQLCDFHFDQDVSIKCIEKPLHNGLIMMDPCRIYYNYIQHYGIEIKSLDCHYSEPYREAGDILKFSQSYLNNKGLWGLE